MARRLVVRKQAVPLSPEAACAAFTRWHPREPCVATLSVPFAVIYNSQSAPVPAFCSWMHSSARAVKAAILGGHPQGCAASGGAGRGAGRCEWSRRWPPCRPGRPTRTWRGRRVRAWCFGASPPTRTRAAPMVLPLGITGHGASVPAPIGLCCSNPADGAGMPRAAPGDVTQQQQHISARHGIGQLCGIWGTLERKEGIIALPDWARSVASFIPTSPGSPMLTRSSCRIALATRTWAMLLRLG